MEKDQKKGKKHPKVGQKARNEGKKGQKVGETPLLPRPTPVRAGPPQIFKNSNLKHVETPNFYTPYFGRYKNGTKKNKNDGKNNKKCGRTIDKLNK